MYCKYCGTKLDDDGFCPKCGIVFETQPRIVYENPQTTYVEKPREIPKTSGMAVAGFVLAVLQIFVDGNISIILALRLFAFVFSLVGMSHTKNGAMRGRGFAVIGLWILLIPFILGLLYGFVTAVR